MQEQLPRHARTIQFNLFADNVRSCTHRQERLAGAKVPLLIKYQL